MAEAEAWLKPPQNKTDQPWRPKSDRPPQSQAFSRPPERPAGGDHRDERRPDRPNRPWQQKPKGPWSDRSAKPGHAGAKPWDKRPQGAPGGRPKSDRPWQNQASSRPAGGDQREERRPDRPDRPWQQKPKGPWSDRSAKPGHAGAKPWDKRPQGAPGGRPKSDRPWQNQASSRPAGGDQRDERRPDRPDRPWQQKPKGPWSDRSAKPGHAGAKPWDKRPQGAPGGRPKSDRPWQQKPKGPWSDRPGKPPQSAGGKPWDKRPQGAPPGKASDRGRVATGPRALRRSRERRPAACFFGQRIRAWSVEAAPGRCPLFQARAAGGSNADSDQDRPAGFIQEEAGTAGSRLILRT